MSLKQTVIEFLQFGQVPDVEGFLAESRVPAAAYAPLSVVAGVAVGGIFAGMPLTSMLICGLVAGGGVALFCAVTGWLFDGLWAPASSDPGIIPVRSAQCTSLATAEPVEFVGDDAVAA